VLLLCIARVWYSGLATQYANIQRQLCSRNHDGFSLHVQWSISLSCSGCLLAVITKHKRWCVNIQEQKTLTHICRELIGRRNPRNVAFAYGMGRFDASSRCYKTAPVYQRWVINRLTKGLHAKVINFNEYNTSQVSSNCFAGRKLCAVGSNRGPFPAQMGSIKKKSLRAKMYSLSHDLEQRCERIEKYGLSRAAQGLWCQPTCGVQQSTG
jgi:hypothetical protein